MTFLLDVNVMIALIAPDHISHDAAHRYYFNFCAPYRATWSGQTISAL
jgi:predicted nucleic acid-binding protein